LYSSSEKHPLTRSKQVVLSSAEITAVFNPNTYDVIYNGKPPIHIKEGKERERGGEREDMADVIYGCGSVG